MSHNMLRSALALLAALLALPCWAQFNYNQESVNALLRAYSFVLGQEHSLRRIEATYPDLYAQVESARFEFGSVFSGVKEGLEQELVAAIGHANFSKLRTELENKVTDLSDQQAITPAVAQKLLGQVKAHAKGDEMEAGVFRYLLAVNYAQNPVGEFQAGFRQRFRTDGSGKAQGIKLSVQLPRSWQAGEGERPHIVRKWTSEGGTGLSSIMLQIQDAQGYNPTAREIEKLIRSGDMKERFSRLGKVHDVGTFSVDGRTGYWCELSMTQERAGVRAYHRGLTYQLFLNGKAIGITCMSGASGGENHKADAAAMLIKPVCQQVIESLVLGELTGDE